MIVRVARRCTYGRIRRLPRARSVFTRSVTRMLTDLGGSRMKRLLRVMLITASFAPGRRLAIHSGR